MPTEAVHVSLEEKILMTVSEGLCDFDVDLQYCAFDLDKRKFKGGKGWWTPRTGGSWVPHTEGG